MEIATEEPMIHALPGDSIALFCQNQQDKVAELLELLGWNGDQQISIKPSEGHDESTIRGIYLATPTGSTIRQVLTYAVDFLAEVRIAVIKVLAHHAKDVVEKKQLYDFVQDQEKFHKEIQAGFLSIVDLLKRFPSSRPPVADLLDVLPPLLPRYFSISSSPLHNPSAVALCFTCVDDKKSDGDIRKGLCTGQLQQIADSLIEGSHLHPTVSFFLKERCQFVYPQDNHKPLLMIAAGTGVAPFRAFVQHRKALMDVDRSKGLQQSPPFGPAWLYMGCMHPEWDDLYRDEWEIALAEGVLQRRVVSFSRFSSEDRIHKRIHADQTEILDLVLGQDAYVYICGQPGLVRETDRVMLELLSSTNPNAADLISEWVKAGKYVREIWD
eukprot:TRINITY_DN3383_c0_g1_i3.p1 TRINITY_DN3383_c0_g1~~TRINITY_DN3383_c0_g1_i3.p1  ORF type:complete len:383 (+),score=89.81 TRINITY_DN3383_c0_g1_i3:1005-2153(+)